ncbi:hypothetical protein BGZ94_001281 [Podila epigama]|nr:hypothetical protein BGZ94_001281 [Podila epigama]
MVKHLFEKRGSSSIIRSCVAPNTLALTFDDGPSAFTDDLLDILDKEKVKATFFMNGDNKSNIYSKDSLIKRMYRSGHQVASHTWSHANLAQISISESIIGVRPVYMRPPYGALNWQAENWLQEQGYEIVLWNIDTNDWQHPNDVSLSMEPYRRMLGKSWSKDQGYIALQHDTISATAYRLAPAIIKYAKQQGFELVTVGTCLEVPPQEWYRK